MSVVTQVERIKGNIASAYAKAGEKGAELPEVQNSANLAAAIETIPSGGGLPEDVFTISVESGNPEGGSVSGGGIVSKDMVVKATVTATPKGEYEFDGWEEDGETVNDAAQYTFPVTADRELIAKFSVPQYVAGRDWWECNISTAFSKFSNICHGNGHFIITIGTSTSNVVLHSSDGINWSEVSVTDKAQRYYIAYGEGKFCILRNGGTNIGDRIDYSENGEKWSFALISAGDTNWQGIVYGNGVFVITPGNSNKLSPTGTLYSEDGVNWKQAGTLGNQLIWKNLSYNKCPDKDYDGMFIVIASNSKYANWSKTGKSWNRTTLPATGAWGNVIYGNGIFLTILRSSSKVAWSENAASWNSATLPSSDDYSTYAYGNRRFVVVAYNTNKAAWSEDGKTWTAVTLPVSAYWTSLIYADGKFIMTAYSNNIVAYSENGENWDLSELPSKSDWGFILYADKKFLVVSSDKICYSSSKGPGV